MFGINLDDVRGYLGYEVPGSPNSHPRDPIIQALINGGVATLQNLFGRNLERAIYRDTFEQLPAKFYLQESPVEQILAFSNGVSDELSGSPSPNMGSYTLFKPTGLIMYPNNRWTGYSRWLRGQGGLVTVTYVGGYATLPPDMYLALLSGIQAADSFQKQIGLYGGTIKRLTVYDVGVTELAVPREGTTTILQDTIASQLAPYLSAQNALTGWLLHECERVGDAP